jgi:BioD-like phosphotransacetylase family protein
MPPFIIVSDAPRQGRTAVAAGLAAYLARAGQSVQLGRLRAGEAADPEAEDDAHTLASVPGVSATGTALTLQEAISAAAAPSGGVILLEAPAGLDLDLVGRLSARAILVTTDPQGLGVAGQTLDGALAGVVVTRQSERSLEQGAAAVESSSLPCLAVLPEDRLLAGPSVREIAEALHASRLVNGASEDEGLEYVMLGAISADPGQPYFLQHASKAVVNRFDKMDLHLAALASEPDCLVLTGGQLPTPYLLDRVANDDLDVSVLLSPDDTVRTIELIDDLYAATRFSGARKVARAVDLFAAHGIADRLSGLA